MEIIIEQKLAHFDAIINVYMLWWVSSVVFCGSIIAAMLNHREKYEELEYIFWVYLFISLYFCTIIFFGFYGIYSIDREQQDISNLLIQNKIFDIPLNEYTTARYSVLIGTTSFIIILVIWCLLWINSYKNRRESKTETREGNMISFQMKKRLSPYHLYSATFFADKARSIEETYKGSLDQLNDKISFEHQAYVVGSIISCVSCLEAYINETFIDFSTQDNWVKNSNDFNDDVKRVISELWNFEILRSERLPILDKYQLFIRFSLKLDLEKGNVIYQDTRLLISLRNAFVHYNSEFVDDENDIGDISDRLFKKFRSKNIEENPFVSIGNSFFPERCISYGYAKWSCNTVISFLNDFSQRANTREINENMIYQSESS